VRSATEVETNVVSVERVQEYTELKPEAPLEIADAAPSDSWPETGALEFKHVSARYRENLDLVLKDVSFKVNGGEKVGVCGRTGAGKSSVTMVLYRIIEAAEGQVLIDGVDVAKIGLHDLRSRLAIIPQDSQCFEGTLRENLDPTGRATDAELWTVLEQAKLKAHVETMVSRYIASSRASSDC
jgi:ABC-type multidrug transport system fused ATPase/permease subunit